MKIVKTTTKKFPIFAGMNTNGTGSNKIKEVGYKVIEFSFAKHNQLVSEKEVKRFIA